LPSFGYSGSQARRPRGSSIHGKTNAQPFRGERSHRHARNPNDDQPGFVADEPEHCHDFYRPIRPGQTYFLTIEQAVVCPDCVRPADAVRLSGGLTVEIGEDKLLVRRGSRKGRDMNKDTLALAFEVLSDLDGHHDWRVTAL
jgi:hypothetical protein